MNLETAPRRKTRWWRVVAVLHSQASLVLAPLLLLPALILLVSTAFVVLWILDAGARQFQALPTFAGSAQRDTWFWVFLGTLPVLAAACAALARAGCRLQGRRLGEPVPDLPEPAGDEGDRDREPWLRVLTALYGAAAWRSVIHAAVLGGWALLGGGTVLVLSAFGLGIPIGMFAALVARLAGASAFGDLSAAQLVGLLVLGPAMALGALWLAPAMVRVDRALAQALIVEPPEVRARRRVATLKETRRRMVDVAENERRRIERDLHDGAQQRLLALTISVSRARGRVSAGPEVIAPLLDEAHAEAKEAMAELREVALGLHPRVLSDHGLVRALPGVTGRCPVPVRLSADLDTRPSARAEAIAYFVTSEALTNVARHARGATNAEVIVEHVRQRRGAELLRVRVHDDGEGGAAPDNGSGLYGLWDRVHAVDGSLTVTSPPGGPTTVIAEIPWEA
ncbi:sensor domain-containing protein [Spiractinospora alimapuensis]|uniref:sensor histidine kinase n=1 Tax=Spiractinospora alimapuensis TaxID=2820884 RepID=UPI001F260C6A|nr:histidine kinase [Spiractinospora alimapuensis]QVQ54432.1 sensor domain-containing protein [Spiractinospora alimapuensis]